MRTTGTASEFGDTILPSVLQNAGTRFAGDYLGKLGRMKLQLRDIAIESACVHDQMPCLTEACRPDLCQLESPPSTSTIVSGVGGT